MPFKNHTALRRSCIALLMFCFTSTVIAAPPINTLQRGFFSDSETGIAINGYDTVAYFTDNKAVPGSAQFSTSWMGATWQFANSEHLAQFKQAQEKYAPQYGGYCAYGVSKGALVSVEPEQFSVVDGKLYLNYDAGVQKKWKKDIAGFNRIADEKFADLLK